jgi:hypothetical protein
VTTSLASKFAPPTYTALETKPHAVGASAGVAAAEEAATRPQLSAAKPPQLIGVAPDSDSDDESQVAVPRGRALSAGPRGLALGGAVVPTLPRARSIFVGLPRRRTPAPPGAAELQHFDEEVVGSRARAPFEAAGSSSSRPASRAPLAAAQALLRAGLLPRLGASSADAALAAAILASPVTTDAVPPRDKIFSASLPKKRN